MPRWFFDLHDDNKIHIDDEGSDLADLEEACKEARRFLPDIARYEIPKDGDKRAFVVLVRDEEGKAVYSATLTYAGVRLRSETTTAKRLPV